MSRLDAAADSLIKYFEKRAKRGHPEARRDWLYGPAHVPGGAWNQDALLDDVIRRVKDRGYELVYVYDRPPVWTCRPSPYVRDKNQWMELQREHAAQERLTRYTPAGTYNLSLASATASTLLAAMQMLEPLVDTAPANDVVLARVDAAGMAN